MNIDFKIPDGKYLTEVNTDIIWSSHTERMVEKNCITEMNSRYELVSKRCMCVLIFLIYNFLVRMFRE